MARDRETERIRQALLSIDSDFTRLRGVRIIKPSHADVLSTTFPEARAFIEDTSPLKFALCTRRAAKSYSVALDFINDSFSFPRASYIILGLTRPEVKMMYWKPVLKDIDLRYNLHAKFNESDLTMTMPNGATIYLIGADANENEKRKLLGGKNRKVCVDEAQAWGTDLRDLVMGHLKPSVSDYEGQIVMCGTPGNLINGFFHQVTKGCKAGYLSPPAMREPGWSGHTWTTFQNPHMARQWKKDIDKLLADNPDVVQVPWFRQMYLGEWVVDLDALCYKFDPARNSFDGVLPQWNGKGEWHYVIAIDLGYYPDPSAFLVFAYHDFDTKLYGLESFKAWKFDITDVATKIRTFESRYTFDAYVIDGANKQAVAEMRRRHNLPLTAADKTGKSDFIELMNAELILGRIVFDLAKCCGGILDTKVNEETKKPESLALADEYAGLIWDQRKLALGKREEHPGCPNHLTDCALYGWRHCYQYLGKRPPEPIRRGTPEWYQSEAARMMEAEREELESRLEAEKEGLPDTTNWEPWAR